jgi:hypothetical protein
MQRRRAIDQTMHVLRAGVLETGFGSSVHYFNIVDNDYYVLACVEYKKLTT